MICRCIVILVACLIIITEGLPIKSKVSKSNHKSIPLFSSSTRVGTKTLLPMTSQSKTRSDPSDSVTVYCPTQKCIEQIKLFIANHPDEGLVLLGDRW